MTGGMAQANGLERYWGFQFTPDLGRAFRISICCFDGDHVTD